MSGLMPALAGANTIYGAGMVELGMTFSAEQLVIDNDVIGMIKSAVRGIEVNDDTLGVESIRTVGAGKDFLALEETRNLIKIQSNPVLFNRDMRGAWEAAGAKDIVQVASEKVQQILKTHQVEPIDKDILKDMEAIVKKADKAALEG